MAVRDDLAAIDAGREVPEEKRRLRWRRKAEVWRDVLAQAEERTFTRGNVSVTITHADLVQGPHYGRDGDEPNALLVADGWAVVIRMRCERNGKVFRRPTEPWIIFNPPSQVQDGEEPNPDYNAAKLGSKPTRTRYKEDIREALRSALIDFLKGKYGG